MTATMFNPFDIAIDEDGNLLPAATAKIVAAAAKYDAEYREGAGGELDESWSADFGPSMAGLAVSMHHLSSIIEMHDGIGEGEPYGPDDECWPIPLRLAGFPKDVMHRLCARAEILTYQMTQGNFSPSELVRCVADEVLLKMAQITLLGSVGMGEMNKVLPAELHRGWDDDQWVTNIDELWDAMIPDEDIALFWNAASGPEILAALNMIRPGDAPDASPANWFTLYARFDGIDHPHADPHAVWTDPEGQK